MEDNTYQEKEQRKIKTLVSLTEASIKDYDIRGIFKISEYGPAGHKSRYEERNIQEASLDNLVGGIFLICPKGDRTNGEVLLEVSVRDSTIRVKKYNYRNIAMFLLNRYEEANCKFCII